jgi:hypothetical protein
MAKRITTLSALAQELQKNDDLASRFKENPALAAAAVAQQAIPDTLIYRMVVGALGLALLMTVVAAVILSWAGKTMPDMLTAIGAGSLGALAGMLAPSPAGN